MISEVKRKVDSRPMRFSTEMEIEREDPAGWGIINVRISALVEQSETEYLVGTVGVEGLRRNDELSSLELQHAEDLLADEARQYEKLAPVFTHGRGDL